jgi:hypothetical protein
MTKGYVEIWRDYDRHATDIGDVMRLCSQAWCDDTRVDVDEVFASGGRYFILGPDVDIDAVDEWGTVQLLGLVRDLTSCGIAVKWNLRLPGWDYAWEDMCHFWPPSCVRIGGDIGTAIGRVWESEFYHGRCVARKGPHLLQVRDRRWGGLRRFNITSLKYLEAIARLEEGGAVTSFESSIIEDLGRARLIRIVGDVAMWLPCRLRRWPIAARTI